MSATSESPKPKRHHWWPMAQSRFWTNTAGFVHVTRRDGSHFQASPTNIGLESELYTRFDRDNKKDTQIEDWFAESIDGPATKLIEHFMNPDNVRRKAFRGDPIKARTVQAVGFRVNPYIDEISLPKEIRLATAQYVAALLVRHPRYLEKLTAFHSEQEPTHREARERALDNMLVLLRQYTQQIARAVVMLSRRADDNEYIYADGGLYVEEPWRTSSGIPFDIHAPLTPDLALQVLPIPFAEDLDRAAVMESTNQGVARQNRIVLGAAERFVFSRRPPPAKFIVESFGKPAPKNIGYRFVDGRLETLFDPSRQ